MRQVAGFAVAALIILSSRTPADWPGFRGAAGGVADDKLPAPLSKDNILWKVKLPGPGASSPIVCGTQIFVTCYAGYGTTLSKGFGKGGFGAFGQQDTGGDQKNLRLFVLCFDTQGKSLWKKEIAPKLPEMTFSNFIKEHGYASSTPVTDGERLYVFFGKTGVFAFDLDGRQLWHQDVGSGTHMWGSAGSPILYNDLVIVNAGIESDSLIALDKKSGKEIWRTLGMGQCWGTPLVVRSPGGKDEIVMNLPGKIAGYDPATGKALWHCQGIGQEGSYSMTTPVAKDGVVYVIGGGGPIPPAAVAVKAGGRGDVSKTHVVWRQKVGTGIASPILRGDTLCWIAGSVMCVSTADGKTKHQDRLYDRFGEYVSPVLVGDKIYALTRFDGLFVLAAGDKFDKLAHIDFEGDTGMFNASPAVSDGRMYIRSNEYLYCLGKK